MVSSFAIRHGNERTLSEMLRIHPDEHPVSIQLFGPEPDVMRGAAAKAAEAGADLIDINMGCPVPKVCKTGAGAALLRDHERALEVARAAVEGSGLPVTVKLRSGSVPGDRSGFDLALRLVHEGRVAGLGFHPRSAAVHHSGEADYALARELVAAVDVPVIISGGLRSAAAAREAYERSGADAVMIARGGLGRPWVFEELTGRRDEPPTDAEVLAELRWVLDRGEEHWGAERASRNLRKFYPWYLEQLGMNGPTADAYQRAESLARVREMLDQLATAPAAGSSVSG
jgi:nifR3 family TIM-barrel protein